MQSCLILALATSTLALSSFPNQQFSSNQVTSTTNPSTISNKQFGQQQPFGNGFNPLGNNQGLGQQGQGLMGNQQFPLNNQQFPNNIFPQQQGQQGAFGNQFNPLTQQQSGCANGQTQTSQFCSAQLPCSTGQICCVRSQNTLFPQQQQQPQFPINTFNQQIPTSQQSQQQPLTNSILPTTQQSRGFGVCQAAITCPIGYTRV
ncbi:unnamed protein product, partial [Mesorhabditis belari]|uniref:Uncharacterized protein n=1 Tax=Mesorhabditis belari TaxID=2138241 RepID=A0AAF3J3U8_9BILA